MTSPVPPENPLRPLFETLQAIGEGVRRATRSFAVDVLPSLLAMAEGMRRLPDELRPMVRALAERGWFISGEMGMSELRHFQHLTESNRPEEVDGLMSTWIDGELDRILDTATHRFPSRGNILSAAISAHKDGSYALSIPVLLIQVEGMCIEILGKKLFATKGGIPRTKEATDALIDGAFSEVIFLPLREAHGLTASEDTRSSWPDAPNRHEILHGISSDYPTRVNSLKAISLLDYFVTFVASERFAPSAATAA